jgi:hypothetical protein
MTRCSASPSPHTLPRSRGQSRAHTASDLNLYLRWCLEKNLRPLQAQRAHVELYLRWLQEVQRLRPSTVSRRLSVLATFYRTCVIDQILDHWSACELHRAARESCCRRFSTQHAWASHLEHDHGEYGDARRRVDDRDDDSRNDDDSDDDPRVGCQER